MIVIGRFDALFRHGPHGQTITPSVGVQRNHGIRDEEQEASVTHTARNGRPIPTGGSHAAERTSAIGTTARSGEKDRRGIAAVGKEVPTKVGIEVGSIFGALHIEFGRIDGVLSCGSKPREGVVGRQLKTDRAGVVNRFDHRKVVTGIRNLRSGIIGRPQVVISVTHRRIAIPGKPPSVEATGMLNAIRDGHVAALILLEQLTGGIEGGLRISGQSAREGILATPLVERVITHFCATGILRDNDVARLMRN